MSAEPYDPGSSVPSPSSKHDPAHRAPGFLPQLLQFNRCMGTRFADCRHRSAPSDPARLALLLEVFGYDTRMGHVLEMRGAKGTWMPAPHVLPSTPMPVLSLVRYVCDRDWPLRLMNPDDERLKLVFGGLDAPSSPAFRPRPPRPIERDEFADDV